MHREMEEQTKYWMWARRKLSGWPQLLNTSVPMIASYNESWEEQAFAEDSAPHLGGCVWPPRSYSCSFCRREFRSAQALGGHMNVHRRDRARLKQCSTPTSENEHDTGHLHHLNPHITPNVSSPVYSTNPNPKPTYGIVASPLYPSTLSGVSIQENCRDYSMVWPSFPSSIVQERVKESPLLSPQSLLDLTPLRPPSCLELRLGSEKRRLEEGRCRGARDFEETISCKRRRTDPVLPSFMKVNSHDALLKLGAGPIEELDLELRLGDSPKAK